MRAAPRSALVGALGCLLLAGANPGRAACRVTPLRTVPLELSGGLMLVSVAVNGVPSRFVLDTGAERTVIGTEAARALKLERDEWVSTDLTGLGGRERQRLGRPASLSLGGIALRRNTMASDNSVVVGTIPTQAGGLPVAGLLGQDFLSVFDLDLDPAHARLTLFGVSGCVGAFLPWKQRYTAVQAIRLVRNILAIPVRVNQEELHAEIDSGAQSSLLLASGVQRLGLSRPGGTIVLRGFGAGSQFGRAQRFAGVQVAGETIGDMTIVASEVRMLRSVDMLLGADWLSPRHVWISWATDQVLVATDAAPSEAAPKGKSP